MKGGMKGKKDAMERRREEREGRLKEEGKDEGMGRKEKERKKKIKKK